MRAVLLAVASMVALPALAETPVDAAALEAAAAQSQGVASEVYDLTPESASPEAGAPGIAPARPEGDPIEAAWFEAHDDLGERVWATRRASFAHGIWNLDGAARALLATPGVPLERAEAAVALAPDLPAAHMAWARARWLEGESPVSALRTAGGALLAFARHPEGALWLGGSVLLLLAMGLAYGGLLSIGVASLFALPHAAHDLADLVSRRMPAFGRAALLATLLIVPVVLGEGVLGLVLGLFAVTAIYGARRQRVALFVAGSAVLCGAFPVAELAGRALGALPQDPVARAALATSRGLVTPADVARLEAAPASDLLARQGLARLARRAGRLGEADALYQSLVAQRPEDPVVLTNAANVRLHLGHMESAFDLYRRALEADDSAVVLFNLSQAYGRAFQVDDLTQALALAQAQNGDLVADLTRLQGTQPEGFVVDLPLATRDLVPRALRRADGNAFAAEFRSTWAPGRLGASWQLVGGILVGTLLLGGLLGKLFRASRWCTRCGRRVCPRCHASASRGALCTPCNRLFYQPELTDRSLRLARIDALRERSERLDKLASGASVVIPGIAGVLARRPLLGFWGALWFVIGAGALLSRDGLVPDPLVAGDAGPLALAVVATLAGAAYAISVGAALAARRRL